MRACLFTALLISSAFARAEDAYLIIDAIRTPDTTRQPTWIGLRKGSRIVHVPTKQSIVSVQPGQYFVSHIDFGETIYSGWGTINLQTEGDIRFVVEPDTITYVGMVQLDWDGSYNLQGSKYKISVLPLQAMLQWACSVQADALKRLPVHVYESGTKVREIKVRCET